ncbi:hypothetical protein [Niastella populi]|uniref:Uncharacterized protein n=1 Tax=Niastella populi TaxID=550983 RepID=A0A1V9GB74_9BACT|nr:hypothetical protein [Niastella populi]OQP67804.1 hypothetical protein A4R26_32775 [Niastella populi]
MTDQNKEISMPFTEIVTNKIQKQAEQISAIEKKLESIHDTSPVLQEIKKQLTEIKVAIVAIKFPIKQMDEFSGNLATGVALLKQPVENKVIHHHHIPKIILIAAVLFIALCLVCCGWYNTVQKLDVHKANDFKYRHLKLNNNLNLQKLLIITDSLYKNQRDFSESVLQREDSVRNMIQMLVDAKEAEVKELKKKIK